MIDWDYLYGKIPNKDKFWDSTIDEQYEMLKAQIPIGIGYNEAIELICRYLKY